MKIGDKVKISDKNLNHVKTDVCAYSGMEGVVTDVYDDGAFILNCGTSILVVPMQNKKGVWIYLNDKLVYHKKIENKLTWFNKINLRISKFFNTFVI